MDLLSTPFIIGVAGGTSSGKTTIAQTIVKHVGSDHAVHIAFDSYYKDLSHLPLAERLKQNFDVPDALDTSLLVTHLKSLRQGIPVEIPNYDFGTCIRLENTNTTEAREVIVVDGILVLAIDELRELFNLKIYIDVDADERLMRRIRRDALSSDRGRSVESVLNQYIQFIRPSHTKYVEPSKKHADLNLPGRVPDLSTLEAITGQIRSRIQAVHRLRALQQIGLHLTSRMFDSDQLLEAIVHTAKAQTDASNVTLHLYDPLAQTFYPVSQSKTTDDPSTLTQPRPDGATTEVIIKEYVKREDVQSVRPTIVTEHMKRSGVQSYIGICLKVGYEPLGVLFINYSKAHVFTIEEEETTKLLAGYASVAINNSRIYSRHLGRLRWINSLGYQIASVAPNDEKLLQRIVELTERETQADNVTIHQYDPEKQSFKDVSQSYSSGNPASLKQPRESGATAQVLGSEHPVVVTDVTLQNPEIVFTDHLLESNVKAYIGIRLQFGGHILGVLFLNYSSAHSFQDDEIEVALVIANYAAVALHNARTYEDGVRSEKQKRRAGQDIIHYVVNRMGDVRLGLIDMIRDPAWALSEEHRLEVTELRKQVEDAIQKSQVAAQGLRTLPPQVLPVDEVIQRTLAFLRNPPYVITVFDTPTAMPSVFVDVEELVRVIAELIVNGQKSARLVQESEPIRVTVKYNVNNRYVSISVSNKGPIIPPDLRDQIFNGLRLDEYGTPVGTRGLGLSSARQFLIHEAGGNLRILESNEHQTTFEVLLPVV